MKTEKPIHQCECDDCKAGQNEEIARQHRQMNVFLSRLNEPQRRWYVGMLSQDESDRQLARITGIDEKTIRRGRREINAELEGLPSDRQRRAGGGRPSAEKKTRN